MCKFDLSTWEEHYDVDGFHTWRKVIDGVQAQVSTAINGDQEWWWFASSSADREVGGRCATGKEALEKLAHALEVEGSTDG